MATMVTLTSAQVNGRADAAPEAPAAAPPQPTRFSDIPTSMDVPIAGDVDNAVEVNLEDLPDDPTELCTLLDDENAARGLWLTAALAYAKHGMVDDAVEILARGLQTLSRVGPPTEKVGLLSLQSWLYLLKHRRAPRVAGEMASVGGVEAPRTKDHWLQRATAALNEATRLQPKFPPLHLGQGVLSLLRASLQPPPRTVSGRVEHGERLRTLGTALQSFRRAAELAHGRNVMAALGEARALFSMGRYADALERYQDVLAKMPALRDPDPRLGIGCCLWQLNHHKEAKEAWERALELVRTIPGEREGVTDAACRTPARTSRAPSLASSS